MRAFVTGATGFIGEHVVRKLRDRGDEVVALVRSPGKASRLADLGCELVEGDLSSPDSLRSGMDGCDAVFHVAAVYKVGIPASARPAMYEANVRGTERVLDAAVEAGATRIVYVSTAGVFGNTRGRVVDESYERTAGQYVSYYDETKYLAHQVALDRIRKGAPIVIANPGGVYGPGDPSELGNMIEQVRTGKLKFRMFADLGINFAHVDDISAGILLIHDRGRIGESYVLGGEIATLGKVMDRVAEIAGRKPPRLSLPVAAAWLGIPFWPVVGRILGFPPNLRELIRTSNGVTYWATDDKARRDLGYSPRALDAGLGDMLAQLRRAS